MNLDNGFSEIKDTTTVPDPLNTLIKIFCWKVNRIVILQSNCNIERSFARSNLLTNWSNNDPNNTIQLWYFLENQIVRKPRITVARAKAIFFLATCWQYWNIDNTENCTRDWQKFVFLRSAFPFFSTKCFPQTPFVPQTPVKRWIFQWTAAYWAIIIIGTIHTFGTIDRKSSFGAFCRVTNLIQNNPTRKRQLQNNPIRKGGIVGTSFMISWGYHEYHWVKTASCLNGKEGI